MSGRQWHVTPDAPGGISWENGPDDPGGSDVQELFCWNDPRDPDTVDAVKALAQCVDTLAKARQLAERIRGDEYDDDDLDSLCDLLDLLTGEGDDE